MNPLTPGIYYQRSSQCRGQFIVVTVFWVMQDCGKITRVFGIDWEGVTREFGMYAENWKRIWG